MRYKPCPDAQGVAVVVIWLLDAGVGIGLFGQGRLALALLTLAALPVAIIVGLFLLSATFTLLSVVAGWLAPSPRET